MVSVVGNCQKEYFTFNVYNNTVEMVKEEKLNITSELELTSNFIYVKATVQYNDFDNGGYLDYGGGLGLVKQFGTFEQTAVYGGVRLGFIRRGFNNDKSYTYPLFGYETGVKHKISDNVFLSIKTTFDYREDYRYDVIDEKYKLSLFFGVNFLL